MNTTKLSWEWNSFSELDRDKLYEILNSHHLPLICESGLKSEKEVEEIVKKTKINNFLIGESLLNDLDKKSSLLKKITQIRP